MKNKIAVLGIDFQKDFTVPAGPNQKQGALYVKGAEDDVKRTARFIMNNIDAIDRIILTMDSHRVVDISHPTGWVDGEGKPIGPMTPISHQDILDGKYSWTLNPQWAREYTKRLEAAGSQHFIWREHCIIGSEGHNIDPVILDAVHAWERRRGGITGAEYVTKGSHPLTEHFGAFQAQVPIDNEPGTQPRLALLHTLQEFDSVFLCGEARSHCVLNTLNQVLMLAPELAPKLVVLEDCMSDVPNPAPNVDFSALFPPVAAKAKAMGTRFALSTDSVGKFASTLVS